jgi:hypothetical protein
MATLRLVHHADYRQPIRPRRFRTRTHHTAFQLTSPPRKTTSAALRLSKSILNASGTGCRHAKLTTTNRIWHHHNCLITQQSHVDLINFQTLQAMQLKWCRRISGCPINKTTTSSTSHISHVPPRNLRLYHLQSAQAWVPLAERLHVPVVSCALGAPAPRKWLVP